MFTTAQKPILGQVVNWDHPLAKDLIGCYLLNERGGNRTWNLVDAMSGTFGKDSTGEVVWRPDGVYTTAYAYINTNAVAPFNLDGSGPMSICCAGIRAGLYNYEAIGGNLTAVSSRGWYARLNNAALDGKAYFAVINDTPTNNYFEIYCTTAIPTNVRYHLVITYGGGRTATNVKFYINSVLGGSSSPRNTLSATSVSANPLNLFRAGYYVANFSYSGTMYFVYVWKRSLDAEEVKWLYADPYCFIQPMRPEWLKFYEAPAGGIPKHWDYYRQMRARA